MTPVHVLSQLQEGVPIFVSQLPCPPSPISPLEHPIGVPKVQVQEFKPGTNPYPLLSLPTLEVGVRPIPLLENHELVFLYDYGVVRLVELEATHQWVVYKCKNERLNAAEVVIIVPRKWVVKTHWDSFKVCLESYWLALKASRPSLCG